MTIEAVNLEAVRIFVKTGRLREVSTQMNVPLVDVQRWSRQVWWQDEVSALRREQNSVMDAMLTSLHGRTIEEMMKLVEEGETIREVKRGKVVERQVPLKGAALARICEVVFSQRQLLRNLPTNIQGDTTKMQSLAEKLRLLGKTIAVEEVEVRDVPKQIQQATTIDRDTEGEGPD